MISDIQNKLRQTKSFVISKTENGSKLEPITNPLRRSIWIPASSDILTVDYVKLKRGLNRKPHEYNGTSGDRDRDRLNLTLILGYAVL